MKKHTLFLVLTCILCLLNQYAQCQISEGGTPISFSLNIDTRSMPIVVMPPVDVETLLREDAKSRKEDILIPFRFGCAIDVNIDIKTAGILELLPNGDKIWLLKIHAPSAYSINLIYNQFHLGSGSKFFIYNEDKTMILGAFTPEVSNNQDNVFATDLLQGNTIILEYYEPESSNDGVIIINKVIHGYVNLFSNRAGESAYCNYDVHCGNSNNTWHNDLKRAVAFIIMGEYVCTGCLINNTNKDRTPYFLTAHHCYYNEKDKPHPGRDPATSIFRFKYWNSGCDTHDSNPNNWKSIIGATVKARYKQTDFVLLELNEKIPIRYNVYYAGWDRTTDPKDWGGAGSILGIHHPRGDVMKKSLGKYKGTVNWWNEVTFKTHWQVEITTGTLQPGSSGSPLFASFTRKIVGQLSGRQNSPCVGENDTDECYCDSLRIGEYGRFDESWKGDGTSATRLKEWLDPQNLQNLYSLDGYDPCPGGMIENLNLNHTIASGPFNYEATDKIVSTGTIQSDAEVKYIAGNSITLKPGFHAQLGSLFQAKIEDNDEGCGYYPPINLVNWTTRACIGDGLKFLITNATSYYVKIFTTNMNSVYEGSGNIIGNSVTVWSATGVTLGLYNATIIFYSPVEVITKTYEIFVESCSSLVLMGDTEPPHQSTDAFLPPSSDNIIIQKDNTVTTFSIIPNPNPGAFQLETNFPLSHIAHLKITNLLGATVYESQKVTSSTIQLPNAATGTHFVVVMLKDGNVLTQKMVVQ